LALLTFWGQTAPLEAAYSGTTNWTYDCVEDIQTFTPPVTGHYLFKVWGAQSGLFNNDARVGKGGYSTGVYEAAADTQLYVYVGCSGKSGTETTLGGWNGGGDVIIPNLDGNNEGGGGATDIRTIDDISSVGLNSRLIVAGGGGGFVLSNAIETDYILGHGGGLTGNNATWQRTDVYNGVAYGATQNQAGYGYTYYSVDEKTVSDCVDVSIADAAGSFGQGAAAARAGGGGGWYGGGAACLIGSGGSGYIGGVDDYHGITADSISGQRNGHGRAEIFLLPELTDVSPASGLTPGGNTVTIGGKYFLNNAASTINAVRIGGVDCTSFTIIDDQSIDCVVPPRASAGTVDVTVVSSYGNTEVLAEAYTYLEPSISLSLIGNPVQLSGMPEQLLADSLTAKVITDNYDGYRLEIEASQPRLKCTLATSDYYIEPLAATGAMADNTWGYAVDDGTLTTPSSWTGMTNSPVAIKITGAATDSVAGDDTVIWFGTKVNSSLPACSYSGTITFTANAN
jgi:hypothetical protein